ncbi:hypothetical protein QAD02_000466 [Eretmocerus hayati]|uniref:Uncharacterized protein n=1 Tax=Eretmocerus hayati TaxID=131215 RepID=A0ACC2NG34_9HYME|nr:hypothetical protein QAD02_000466 [Eretmocerus hayati]
MPGCAVIGRKNSSVKGVKMCYIPREQNLRNQWIQQINRPGWLPTNHNAICRYHFAPDMWERPRDDGTLKLKSGAAHTIFGDHVHQVGAGRNQQANQEDGIENGNFENLNINDPQQELNHELRPNCSQCLPNDPPQVNVRPNDVISQLMVTGADNDLESGVELNVRHEILRVETDVGLEVHRIEANDSHEIPRVEVDVLPAESNNFPTQIEANRGEQYVANESNHDPAVHTIVMNGPQSSIEGFTSLAECMNGRFGLPQNIYTIAQNPIRVQPMGEGVTSDRMNGTANDLNIVDDDRAVLVDSQELNPDNHTVEVEVGGPSVEADNIESQADDANHESDRLKQLEEAYKRLQDQNLILQRELEEEKRSKSQLQIRVRNLEKEVRIVSRTSEVVQKFLNPDQVE